MLKLKNVSKFYYNKGVIASGFSKINIEFKLGEFVAIVGESGSGKSTLLNVISGLDSYEDGEMYINGEETSHYRETEFEEYRKKYVSNIFQNFNLINSYTVYQNIELVLLINGHKKSEIKDKVLELINKVNLNKYKNTKVSKLSGGQKQRVAIARALAKDTPIIACDEPTASLDSKAAKEVIKVLKEVSRDKLVIVVTHNFSEIEDVATRVVKMHDGKIVSDKVISEGKDEEIFTDNESQNIKPINIVRLGVRNTFNVIPKFLLIFIVFFFITVSLLGVYASLKKSDHENNRLKINHFFNDNSDTRIVLKKKDNTTFNDDDFKTIKNVTNVSEIVEIDTLMDDMLGFESIDEDSFYIMGYLKDIDSFNGKLDYGRMPENDHEVVMDAVSYDYFFSEKFDETISKTYYFGNDRNEFYFKIVGVRFVTIDEDNSSSPEAIYGSRKLIDEYVKVLNRQSSGIKININNKNYTPGMSTVYDINVNKKVPEGCVYASEYIHSACKNFSCKNKSLKITVTNPNYSDELNLKFCTFYTKKNFKSLLGVKEEEYAEGSMFMNPNDYDKLFKRDSYQISVITNRFDKVEDVANELENLGYTTFQMQKSLVNAAGEALHILKIIKLVVIILLIVTLFFISYFVIKLILKSRNVYYSTLRILGANFKHIKRILDIELFVNSTLAYCVYIGLIILVSKHIIYFKPIVDIIDYLVLKDYIGMYIILVSMSYLISSRYARKIFKSSAMKTYREEV